MNLLEYIDRNLDTAGRALVKQLLNKPWSARLGTLKRHVPAELGDRFEMLRRDVLARLAISGGRRAPWMHRAVHAVAVGVRVPEAAGRTRYAGLNDREWVDQIWAQVVEDVEASGYSSRAFSEADRAAFLMLYTLAHACVFVIARVHVPAVVERQAVSMERASGALDAHRLYWFAHYLSSHSFISDHLHVAGLVRGFQGDGISVQRAFHASSRVLAETRDHFIDKYLSLHPGYIQLMEDGDRGAIRAMERRCALIVHIHVWMIWQQLETAKLEGELRSDRMLPLEIARAELQQAGFRDEEVDELLAECKARAVGDRFLEERGNGQVQLGDLSLKYALQAHCHADLEKMRGRGMWFEKKYIANYIRERVPAARYGVFEGINDPVERYDADVIILDKRTRALLFCQVKHRAVTLHPHLRDEMREYSSNEAILKGLRQIKRVRECIGSEGVLTRVRQSLGNKRLTSRELSERARFLMIHTSGSLDFCTSEGVAMYEWNTLRSLMKGTMDFVSRTGLLRKSSAELGLELHDPVQTMEQLWNWLDRNLPAEQSMNPSAQWAFLASARLVFEARSFLRVWKLGPRPCAPFRLDFPLT